MVVIKRQRSEASCPDVDERRSRRDMKRRKERFLARKRAREGSEGSNKKAKE
jgi:hypothetical protein